MKYQLIPKDPCSEIVSFDNEQECIQDLAKFPDQYEPKIFYVSKDQIEESKEVIVRVVLALSKGGNGGHYRLVHIKKENNEYLKAYYYENDDTWSFPGELAFVYDLGNFEQIPSIGEEKKLSVFNYEMIISYERKYNKRWADNESIIVEIVGDE